MQFDRVKRRLRPVSGPAASGAADTMADSSPTVGDELARAAAEVRSSELERAAVRLRRLRERAPNQAVVHHRLARVLERLGDLPGATASYEDAVERDPSKAAWHFQLGNVRQLAGDLEGAARAYQGAVDRDPSHGTWHARLGWCRRKTGDFAGAAHAYREATLRDPSREMWHFWLGVCLERARDWPGATVALKRADLVAIQHDPPHEPPSRRLPYERRVWLSLIRRPQYGYGIHRACQLASKLGLSRITAVEFGVAGGNGLVAMETNAAEIAELTGVAVDVVGFDTGGGLYEPIDARDMPYFFAAGAYAMDVPALRSRLRHARLILGDATETFAEFLASAPAPIGFMSFDMDVYSASKGVLDHLSEGADDAWFLPRTPVYFDDVAGWQGQDYNPHAGELLAIEEFNAENRDVKLAEDRTFRTLPVNHTWHHGAYTLHRFAHPQYDTYVSPADAASLALKPGPEG
ncbi:tetratricopeptide repeat protein [Nitriliruptor alkaliphilus]|uniref:tetratricopeptide repeat protein n=1 Tax=Nitriliruptor alkaliphilus TaxID=427918 RepID=UPI000698006B|nr:tetratricopeptide repeat protein [Nitriliruptor alkaliphilus]